MFNNVKEILNKCHNTVLNYIIYFILFFQKILIKILKNVK